jgi:tetratricopeptide (TPR) repeat protein
VAGGESLTLSLSFYVLDDDKLEAFERDRGPGHPAAAAAANDLGALLLIMGDAEGAVELLRRSLSAREAALGRDHRETLEAASNLAVALMASGDYAGSWEHSAAVLDSRSRTLGESHGLTIAAMISLGAACAALSDNEGARAAYKRALDASAGSLGPWHPDVRKASYGFASQLSFLGRHGEAVEFLERELAAASGEGRGPSHPYAVTALCHLGTALGRADRHAEARDCFRAALPDVKRIDGDAVSDAYIVAVNLARALAKTGELLEARSILESALQGYKAALGDDCPEARVVESLLASIAATLASPGTGSPSPPERERADPGLARAADLARAREFLKAQEEAFGEGSENAIEAALHLGLALKEAGGAREAEEVLCRALDAARKSLPGGHPAILALSVVTKGIERLDLEELESIRLQFEGVLAETDSHQGGGRPLTEECRIALDRVLKLIALKGGN